MSENDKNAQLTKFAILGFVALSIATLIGLHLAYGPRWYQGYAPEQPIPFSHALHAGQYKVPCLYCHGSAEKHAFSAIPELQTCMNCHHAAKTDSPWIQKITKAYNDGQAIAWVKVHVLPDFVHFNHRAHVSAGVECATCHGDVEKMDKVYQAKKLSMGWCMDCHRNDDYLSEHRIQLLNEKAKMEGGPTPEWMEWIGGHQFYQNADVSCSTCHY